METTLYDRPREKLLQKGVSALTNAELLQIIIGSGNASAPVAKIARKVDVMLKTHREVVTVGDLTTIQGLGVVKSGQIIASLELAARLLSQNGGEEYSDINVLAGLYADIRVSKKPLLLYAFFDGNGRLVNDFSEVINPKVHTARLARKIFGEALSQSAASVLVAIGGIDQLLEPTMFELSLARDVYSTSRLLSMPVRSFVLVGTSGEYVIKEANRG